MIHLDRFINYSYSFGKQPANRVFKSKNCCFPDQGKVARHTNKFTQKELDLTKSFAAAKASPVASATRRSRDIKIPLCLPVVVRKSLIQ